MSPHCLSANDYAPYDDGGIDKPDHSNESNPARGGHDPRHEYEKGDKEGSRIAHGSKYAPDEYELACARFRECHPTAAPCHAPRDELAEADGPGVRYEASRPRGMVVYKPLLCSPSLR
jgi:hypothetical protein